MSAFDVRIHSIRCRKNRRRPRSRNAVWEHLRGLGEEGTTVFLTTQDLEEADRTCDRVAILDAGRMSGPARVRTRPARAAPGQHLMNSGNN